MASDWYEEMEKAEQEYDAREYELAQEYSRGYEQGRADKDKELSELPNQYSEKLWKNAYDRGYQQGRADATEELPTSLYCDGFNDGYPKGRADAIEEIETELVDIILGNEEITDCQKREIILCLEFMGSVIEQLKEQNND